ncbi:hypothetical protein DFJ73DRAFT_482601 [Zopfochytrium polystomum]|nr:hypothetical protein DFJ73DRAFT_482601 [Zopfochytrium polystomum]
MASEKFLFIISPFFFSSFFSPTRSPRFGFLSRPLPSMASSHFTVFRISFSVCVSQLAWRTLVFSPVFFFIFRLITSILSTFLSFALGIVQPVERICAFRQFCLPPWLLLLCSLVLSVLHVEVEMIVMSGSSAIFHFHFQELRKPFSGLFFFSLVLLQSSFLLFFCLC